MDCREERDYVAALYASSGWKARVAEMGCEQVQDIYLRNLADPRRVNMKPIDPSSSEGGSARPLPCPLCESTKGYSRVGTYRVQCINCNSLLQNSEVNIEDQAPLGESE